jgi:hypothetical protein
MPLGNQAPVFCPPWLKFATGRADIPASSDCTSCENFADRAELGGCFLERSPPGRSRRPAANEDLAMTLPAHLRRLTLSALLALATGLVGCASMQEKTSKLTAELAPGTGPAGAPPAKYYVEMHPEKGKPQRVTRDLAGPTHVQTALEETGAAKKWARMHVQLLRPLPSGGWHKMELEFDRATRRVPPEFDYALMPGDRIIVEQDTSNILDDIMKATLEPLGFHTPTRKPKVSDKYQIRG